MTTTNSPMPSPATTTPAATASAAHTPDPAANTLLVRRMIADFRRGDLEAVAMHFSDDAVWDLPGRGTLAGVYTGPQQITGFLARSYELSGGTLDLEVIDVLGSNRGAAQLQRVTAHRDGRQLDCVEALVHEIVDGYIVRTHHRPDAHALDDFFG